MALGAARTFCEAAGGARAAAHADHDGMPRRAQRHHSQRHSALCRAQLLTLGVAAAAACFVQIALAGESGSIPIFSFDRGPVQCEPDASNFTYIVSSDVQLWYWSRDGRSVKDMGEKTNQAQLDLWRAATQLTWDGIANGTNMQPPVALVVNGDLTNYGLTEEWQQYRRMFHSPDVDWPVFMGLGNHDLMNNVNCWDWGVDSTTCMRNSITTLRQTLSGVSIPSATLRAFARLSGPLRGNINERLNAFDWGSMAYSWDQGNYHFIMLHFHPAYSLDYGSFNMAGPVVLTPSYDFLDKELAKAKATGRKVVLFIHDVDEHWIAAADTRFMESLAGQPVVAVFCGHWHWMHGQVATLEPSASQSIPVFRSGSSEFQTSFIAEFGEKGMRLQVVASSDEYGGQPGPIKDQFYQVDTSQYKCRARLNNIDLAPPAAQCAPNWTLEAGECRAPCPDGWHLSEGRCKRTSCGPTEEQSGLLCYPPCKEGYTGVGPACWRHCPHGWTTLLFLCFVNDCPDTMTREGGMCYGDCKPGYHPVGAVCWEACPEGFDDIGAFCQKRSKSIGKASYSRSSTTALSILSRDTYGRGGGLPILGSVQQDHYTLPDSTAPGVASSQVALSSIDP